MPLFFETIDCCTLEFVGIALAARCGLLSDAVEASDGGVGGVMALLLGTLLAWRFGLSGVV